MLDQSDKNPFQNRTKAQPSKLSKHLGKPPRDR
jgi:hypothetical protein